MKIFPNKHGLGLSIAAVTLVTGVISAASFNSLFAQSTQPTEQDVEVSQVGQQAGIRASHMVESQMMVEPWNPGYISSDELLANALDLTPVELEAAYKKAFELAVTQAVTDGELTQAQADTLLTDEDGELTQAQPDALLIDEDGEFAPVAFSFNFEATAFLAQALDLTEEEFNAAIDGSIQKAADDGLITQAEANEMLLDKLIQEKQREAYKQALDEAVNQGLITQRRAERMLESTTESAIMIGNGYSMNPWGQSGQVESFVVESGTHFGFMPGAMGEEYLEFNGSFPGEGDHFSYMPRFDFFNR